MWYFVTQFGPVFRPLTAESLLSPIAGENKKTVYTSQLTQGDPMKTFALLMMTLLLAASATAASTFKVFFTFDFSNGSAPNGGLIRDSAGNFYGTTQFGGTSNRGIVFELSPKGE